MSASEFTCFVYHRFGDDRYPSTNISLAAFRGQLEFLRDGGFTVLTLGEALRRQAADRRDGPTVVLTVDDGYGTFLTGAMPLLREFGMPATLFVSTDPVGGGDMLSWEELAGLAAEGVEIGNHTASHAFFLDLPEAERARRFRQDVTAAQRELGARLPQPPTLFSYPYGEFDPAMRDVVRDLGFVAAAAQNSGVVGVHADPFALPRFPMGGPYATVDGFADKARMRALPVVAVTPASCVVTTPEPPALHLRVLRAPLRLTGAQCFVAGQSACSLRFGSSADTMRPDTMHPDTMHPDTVHPDTVDIVMQAWQPLRRRRTLYTVTAPGRRDGAWYWFSHVWVRPDGDD